MTCLESMGLELPSLKQGLFKSGGTNDFRIKNQKLERISINISMICAFCNEKGEMVTIFMEINENYVKKQPDSINGR